MAAHDRSSLSNRRSTSKGDLAIPSNRSVTAPFESKKKSKDYQGSSMSIPSSKSTLMAEADPPSPQRVTVETNEIQTRRAAIRAARAELEANAPLEVRKSLKPLKMSPRSGGEHTPRRPANAFLLFSRWRRDNLDGSVGMSPKDVSRRLGEEWKGLDEENRNYFKKHAELLRKEFEFLYPDYKYSRSVKKEKAKKKEAEDEQRQVHVATMRDSDMWKKVFGGKKAKEEEQMYEKLAFEFSSTSRSPSPSKHKSESEFRESQPDTSIGSSYGYFEGWEMREEPQEAGERYEDERHRSRPTSRSVAERSLGSHQRPTSSTSYESSGYDSASSFQSYHEPSTFNYSPSTLARSSSHGHQSHLDESHYREEGQYLGPTFNHRYSDSLQPQTQSLAQAQARSQSQSHLDPHHGYSPAPLSHSHSPAAFQPLSRSSFIDHLAPELRESLSTYDDYSSETSTQVYHPQASTFRDSHGQTSAPRSPFYHQSSTHESQQELSSAYCYRTDRQTDYQVAAPVLPYSSHSTYGSSSSSLGPIPHVLPTSDQQGGTRDIQFGSKGALEMIRHVNHLVQVIGDLAQDWRSDYSNYS